MGIATEITDDWQAALAALAWQVDLGVTESVGEVPVDRYALAETVKVAAPVVLTPVVGSDAVAVARAIWRRGPGRWRSCAARWRGSICAN